MIFGDFNVENRVTEAWEARLSSGRSKVNGPDALEAMTKMALRLPMS